MLVTQKKIIIIYIFKTQDNVYLTDCLTIAHANTRIFIKCEKLQHFFGKKLIIDSKFVKQLSSIQQTDFVTLQCCNKHVQLRNITNVSPQYQHQLFGLYLFPLDCFFWITIMVRLAIFLPASGIMHISNGVSGNIAILPLLRCGSISGDIPLESIGYVPNMILMCFLV